MEPPQHQQLIALRDKYQAMRSLRLDAHGDEPRARLIALARDYPGALRELDQLPLPVLEERLSAIERVLAERAEPQTWMRLQIGYHGFMRAVLRIRRLSRGRSAPIEDAALELAALPYQPLPDEPPVARFSAEDLETIRRPPGGRLNPWVYAQVAQDCGTTPDLVLKALFLR
jgi:hypothetical protein